MADIKIQTIPEGPLSIIAPKGIEPLAKKVDEYLVQWRSEREAAAEEMIHFRGYQKKSYIVDASLPRFGSGEGKCVINDSVRGEDIYIMTDVLNYSLTYKLCGMENHMSPDDHYQDLKRIISAIEGKGRRINVIMPFLYESRQHKRTRRESLDCAMMLQELVGLGVENIITFEAHDPRVANAIPDKGFDSVACTYQFLKALVKAVPDIEFDSEQLMCISPDEGAMDRAVTFATYLGVDAGTFYKRRDYSTIVDGRNPIIAHEYLGRNVKGKDVLVIDDMISSGDSMIDVASALKKREARRVFVFSTFGLFTSGMKKFDDAVEAGIIDKVFTTNLTYQKPENFERDYHVCVDLSKYLALIIDALNHNSTISDLLSPSERIKRLLEKHKEDLAKAKEDAAK